MRNTGRRWLEENRKEGGRFTSLDITITILPWDVHRETTVEEDKDKKYLFDKSRIYRMKKERSDE